MATEQNQFADNLASQRLGSSEPAANQLLRTLHTSLFGGSIPVRAALEEYLLREGDGLVHQVFVELLADPEVAESFANADLDKLEGSVSYWLKGLFAASGDEDFGKVAEFSKKIGELHARINVQYWELCRFRNALLEIGTVRLRESFSEFQKIDDIVLHYTAALSRCFDYIADIYFINLIDKAQFFDGFRKNMLSSNVIEDSHEKKFKIREWFDDTLHALYRRQYPTLTSFSESQYGIWWRHKGKVLFDELEDSISLDICIEKIDHFIRICRLDERKAKADTFDVAALDQLELLVKELEYHHDNLFERAGSIGNVTDHLTSLLDKRMISGLLSKEAVSSQKTGQPFTLMMMDIDNFKSVNDTYGHYAGDLVLRRVATIILAEVRSGDYVFRYGGEEILVVLVEATKEIGAKIAERIRRNLEQEAIVLESGETVNVTISVGIAEHSAGRDYQRSLNRADDALYDAKEDGKNCIRTG